MPNEAVYFFTLPAVNDNINSMLDRFLIKWRSKGTVSHGDDAKTFAQFSKLLQVCESHGWIAWGFTIQNLKDKR